MSPVGPNDVWAVDFVHDQLATGKKLRLLTVVDTFSRYVPALDVRFSYCGESPWPLVSVRRSSGHFMDEGADPFGDAARNTLDRIEVGDAGHHQFCWQGFAFGEQVDGVPPMRKTAIDDDRCESKN